MRSFVAEEIVKSAECEIVYLPPFARLEPDRTSLVFFEKKDERKT
jgi:hypothetical protein